MQFICVDQMHATVRKRKENMGTQTQVKTAPIVAGKVSTKLVSAIKAFALSTVQTFGLQRAVSVCLLSEANKLKLDQNGARKLAADSWAVAYRQDAASLKIDNEDWTQVQIDQAVAIFAMKSRPDVSKAMRLAYPASDKAKAELEKAYAHNDALPANTPKAERIGQNTLLEIARGEKSCADALAVKASGKAKKSGLDSVSTPAERLQGSFKGIFIQHGIGNKGKLTADECREAFNVALDAYLNPAKVTTDTPDKPAKKAKAKTK